MNTSALLGFSASILLAAGLAGCAGAPGESGAQSAVSSSTPSPSETPSPTPTPAKSYTSDELAALVGQLTDAKGVKLAVMSSTDLTGSAEQVKALLSTMSVEPAVCQEMAISGAAPSVDGATAAMGTSLDAAEGASTAVAMTSGLDPAYLEQAMAQADQLSKCANMTIGMAGTKVDVALTLIDGVGTVPGTLAYRTDSTLPDGRKQSMITAQVVVQGVLITVISSGGTTEEGALSRTGAMLDQAGAQIK